MSATQVAAAVRSVAQVHGTVKTMEGAGFPVRRPFPTESLMQFDPFLLLDHFGPVVWAPGEALGAPDHPHRGFETVSYLLSGKMRHRDSQGHTGALGPGDVQWMTAGAGIVHAEMPDPDFARAGGRMEGFQIWVNLPRTDKMMKPRYQDVPAERIPVARNDDGTVSVRLIAGEALGVKAVIDTRTPILYHHWTLAPGAKVVAAVPEDFNVLVYGIRGGGRVGEGGGARALGEGFMAALANDGLAVALEAGPEGLDALVLGGRPLREPVARYGPFVMNTPGEIKQAFLDYQAGRMGTIPADAG